MKQTYRAQPRIPGMRRTSRYTGLLPALDEAVRLDAARFKVRPSFVLAYAAALTMARRHPRIARLLLRLQPDYMTHERSKSRRSRLHRVA